MQKQKKSTAIYWQIATIILLSFGPSYGQKKAIIIQDQGSFAVGGTVITAPGTFDPIKHGAFNPANQSSEGQTLHGDHALRIPGKTNGVHPLQWRSCGEIQ